MRPLPPTYFLGAVVGMSALHLALPGVRWVGWPWNLAGIPFVLLGLIVNVLSSNLFQTQGTTIRPFEESRVLVISGPFRFSRNPMYLGMVLSLVGFGFLLGTLTPLAVIPLFVWLLTKRFIVPEESALTDRFGQAYREYTTRVRRWL